MVATPAPSGSRAVGDLGVVALAAAFAAGALAAREVHPALLGAAVALAVGGLVRRHVWLLVAAAPVLGSWWGAAAWVAVAPTDPGPLRAEAVVLTDPVDEPGASSIEVRVDDGRHLVAVARDAPRRELRRLQAGEVVALDGSVAPRPDHHLAAARRHLVGRLEVRSVRVVGEGNVVARLANAVRGTIVGGAASMDPATRALFTGFVLGDDRAQRDEVVDDFRASGLSHLVAVSGENVAFVLALVAPLLRRLGLRARFAVVVAVLVVFAVVVRLEPSVLRATAMAGVAAWAALVGRPVSRWRTLALAGLGLVVVDPLIVGRVGFALSVGACVGIGVLAAPLARSVPGPGWLRRSVGVSTAAQIGVLPVAIPVFGGVPVVSIVANVLAIPAAGPVMMWGLTGGVLAGVAGEPLATLLHLPTRVLVGWVAAVATVAARVPLGEVGAVHVLVVGAAGVAGLLAVPAAGRAALRGALAGGLLLALALAVLVPPRDDAALGAGAVVHESGGEIVIVLDGRARTDRVLEGLRRRGRPEVHALVLRSAARSLPPLVEAVRGRVRVARVVGPADANVPDVEVPRAGDRIGRGEAAVVVRAVRADALEVGG